jgi:hypothetical protein
MADAVVLRRAGELILSNLVWTLPAPSNEFRTGHLHIDAADQAVKTQTAAVYELLQQALGDAHPVHQRVHLRDLRDHAGWAQVMRERFPDWSPATTVLSENGGLPAGAGLAVEVIATEQLRSPSALPTPSRRQSVRRLDSPSRRSSLERRYPDGVDGAAPRTRRRGGRRSRRCSSENGYTRYHRGVHARRRRPSHLFDRVDDAAGDDGRS